MTRTNIDIDDDLIYEVMRRWGIRTKKDAVEDRRLAQILSSSYAAAVGMAAFQNLDQKKPSRIANDSGRYFGVDRIFATQRRPGRRRNIQTY